MNASNRLAIAMVCIAASAAVLALEYVVLSLGVAKL